MKSLTPFLTNKFNHQVFGEKKDTFILKYHFVEDMLIFGYFQSYKYFDQYKNNILRLIKFDDFKKNCGKTHNISIHFRIGDYKHNTKAHPILPIQYYIKSLTTYN